MSKNKNKMTPQEKLNKLNKTIFDDLVSRSHKFEITINEESTPSEIKKAKDALDDIKLLLKDVKHGSFVNLPLESLKGIKVNLKAIDDGLEYAKKLEESLSKLSRTVYVILEKSYTPNSYGGSAECTVSIAEITTDKSVCDSYTNNRYTEYEVTEYNIER